MSGGRWLVVNADDFGLSAGVNAGIIEAHARGLVTSTSLMVRGEAATDAAGLARAHPELGVGLHLDLGEWRCVDGRWRAVYEVVDARDAVAVAAEIERQLEAFHDLLGRAPTHVDSHQHVHREEPVRSLLGRRARELRVPLRHHGAIRYRGDFYGHGHDGEPRPQGVTATALRSILKSLAPGVSELCCHPAARVTPGMDYGRERLLELEALVDPVTRRATGDEGVTLVNFEQAASALRRGDVEREAAAADAPSR